MPVTNHQREKIDQVKELFKSGNLRVRLTGLAGCGKTWACDTIINEIKADKTIFPHTKRAPIFATAPTNKALAVLKTKITGNVVFKTIHSALKISKYVDNKTGIEGFRRNPYMSRNSVNIEQAQFVIIDEASMLPSLLEGNGLPEGHKDYIHGYLEEIGVPILYIGDYHQLNPVGEDISPVWKKDYPEVELTEIIRQGEGNPIIDLSRDLDMIYFKRPRVIDGKGYTYSNELHKMIDDLAEVNGTDDLKYLAFTNNIVNKMNMLVRCKRYGNPKRIEKGETLVMNSPFGEFFTNKEVKVENVEIITDSEPVPKSTTRFDKDDQPIGAMDTIRLKYYLINGSIRVIHEHSDEAFKAVNDALKENATKFGWGHKGKVWFRDKFADIKYNHAITIHKS